LAPILKNKKAFVFVSPFVTGTGQIKSLIPIPENKKALLFFSLLYPEPE